MLILHETIPALAFWVDIHYNRNGSFICMGVNGFDVNGKARRQAEHMPSPKTGKLQIQMPITHLLPLL